MENHSESKGPRLSDLAESHRAHSHVPIYAAEPDPSLPAALEKLASATQGVLTKRIDLVMLEVNEMVGVLVLRSALVGFGVLVALAAWFGGISALVLALAPSLSTAVHLGIFALINAVVGGAVIAYALRQQRPQRGTEGDLEDELREDRGAPLLKRGNHNGK